MNKMTYKQTLSRIFTFLIVLLCIPLLFTFDSLAHSGRTDSSGGHRDNKNKSGLGYYHYHCGGYPPHLHSSGCPYSVKVQTKKKQDKINVKYDETMYIGGSQQVDYNIISDSYEKPSFSSSDSKIVMVYGNKLVAQGVGTATITIESKNNSKKILITVKPIAVNNITLSEESVNIQIGQQKKIEVTISPSDATDKDIKWSVENGDILSISDGLLVAKEEGITTVWATSSNGICKSMQVEVYNVIPVSIASNFDNVKMEITDIGSVKIEVLPKNANNKAYSVSIKDDSIANIAKESDKLNLTPMKVGKTEISIATWNGIEKCIPVEIYSIPIKGLEIDTVNFPFFHNKFIDVKNDAIPLTGIFSPENCTYKDLIWVVSNYDVADINDKNELVIKDTGRVTITCLSTENKNIHSSVEIIIINRDMTILVFLMIITLLSIILMNLGKIKQWHCNGCKSDF